MKVGGTRGTATPPGTKPKPNQERFAEMIRAAGLERVSYRNLTGGIAAIHSGWKL